MCKFWQCVINKGIVFFVILILIQTWTSVRTTTTAAVYMTASTYLATTGAPATMDSCWHTMATTVWVRQLGLFKSFSSAYYFVFQAYADGICGFNAHSHSQGTLGTMSRTGLLWLQTGRYPNHASLRDILTCLYTSMVKFWSAWGKRCLDAFVMRRVAQRISFQFTHNPAPASSSKLDVSAWWQEYKSARTELFLFLFPVLLAVKFVGVPLQLNLFKHPLKKKPQILNDNYYYYY